MKVNIDPRSISGLSSDEISLFSELLIEYQRHQGPNLRKLKYYEGNISVNEVNLGIALPDGLSRLEIGCSWGAKAVDVLASRSMFDGFVGAYGEDVEDLDRIVAGNRLVASYATACRDELLFGATFCTLGADEKTGAKIRFHSPMSAAALWDGDKGRIRGGFSILDTAPDNDPLKEWSPSLLRLDTANAVLIFQRHGERWTFERLPHKMGQPLMVALVYNATSQKPFGRSRIKRPIRKLIDSYVRTLANATIGLEFSTAPQKYLLGITDEQYDAVIDQKFKQYVGSMLAATSNPETGEKPVFGQLPQGSIEPHVQMLRMISTQFSAATGLTVTDTGVVNDANPTSSDAILAQSQTLVATAEQLNTSNGDALKLIGLMALAIANNCQIEDLSAEQTEIVPHFKNPAMPSVAVTADAAIKIATARPAFAETDTFLEMIGFDQADIRRIRAQEQRVAGSRVLLEEFAIEAETEQ